MDLWRGRPGPSVDEFPGESAWRWRLQLKAERIISPLRAVLAAINTAVWAWLPPAPGAIPWLAWTLTGAVWCYVVVDLLLLYRRPALAGRVPYRSVLLDAAFLVGWIEATGGSRSPFLPVIIIGVISVGPRLPLGRGLMAAALYAGIAAVLGGPEHLLLAGYGLIGGVGMCAWVWVLANDRRNSLRDALTGAFGREYGFFQIEELLQGKELPFCVGLVDLDGFKGINDQLGHLTGDLVLTTCARALTAVMRPGDLLVRFGGDEFLVVWPNVPLEQACAIAERVRLEMEGSAFRVRGEQTLVRLTTSIGVAEARSGDTAVDLLQRVDDALYRAKAERNRVVAARAVGLAAPAPPEWLEEVVAG